MEERVMPGLNLALLLLTATSAFLGVWAIYWARGSRDQRKAAWGRCLFVLTQLFLGGCGLVAAGDLADALAPLGLCAGLLVVGMIWEPPHLARAAGRLDMADFLE
jgi:hypothetical protein